MALIHPTTCGCCSDLLRGMYSRRRFLVGAAAAAVAAMLPPDLLTAAEGNYEAMVLGCIDPRMPEPMHRYTTRHHLTGKFSQFIIAGAAIGVVAEPFKGWRKTFWDNLDTTIQLHHIKRVIAIDHRDCGAAKIAYGAAKVANSKIETETHRTAMTKFRRQVHERHPKLKVEIGLMALDGKMEMFT
jgi:carbonic anhydrase